MKKRSALIFGLPAMVLAFSMVLAGCEDPNGGGGGGGGGGDDGITIDSFVGEWEGITNSNATLTVTKVAEQDKFTLVYSWGSGGNAATYTYTLSYSGSIVDLSSDGSNFKGVPFTGTGTRTSGTGVVFENTDHGGLFGYAQLIDTTSSPSATNTPAGYLGIDTNGFLAVYYVYSGGYFTIDGDDDNYGCQSFERPSN